MKLSTKICKFIWFHVKCEGSVASPEGSVASLANPWPRFRVPCQNSELQEMAPRPHVRIPISRKWLPGLQEDPGASGGLMRLHGAPWGPMDLRCAA